MGMRPVALAEEEWYHCYSRTVDRGESFMQHGDYERFLESMYLANSDTLINRSAFKHFSHERILNISRGKQLIEIGAYALMPNHYHLLIKQVAPDGISQFMHRLGTSYTMYFNLRNKRVGNLFIRPFRARHVDSDRYLQKVTKYIHFNPLDITYPTWRSCTTNEYKKIVMSLESYPYSSLPDYSGMSRVENRLVDIPPNSPILPSDAKQLETALAETMDYNAELDF